jgi:hypothetical protein
MTPIDPAKERERLVKLYAGMSDGELLKVGKDPAALTDQAFVVLRQEVARRGLEWIGSDMPLPSQIEKKEAAEDLGNTPVVLRQYRDMPEAISDRMVLEAAGIQCYLANENMVRTDWLWSNLLGGMKLLVKQSDMEDAAKLIDSRAEEKFVVEGVGEYKKERCPNCGSDDVSCDELMKRIAAAGLLLQLPIAMTQRGWNCHVCGHAWEVADTLKTDNDGGL